MHIVNVSQEYRGLAVCALYMNCACASLLPDSSSAEIARAVMMAFTCINYVTNISRIIINSLNLHEYAFVIPMKHVYRMRQLMILLMAVSLFTVTGCDFFRTLAGRPTSEDIEQKKVEILRAEQAVLQARLDSIRLEQQMVQDSIAALDSIRQYGGTILNPAKLGGLFATKLEARYYVIIGAFKKRSNAEALLCKAADSGYAPALISFNNGIIAVGLCPCSNIVGAKEALMKVKKEVFCPSDVWILLNE